jgi:MtaA/CmuA family methyltransferase
MNGRERALAMLAGETTDRPPCMPITMMFAADILRVKYREYAGDYRAMADAQVKTAEQFGFDHVSAIGPPGPEIADLGAKLQWYEDQPPAMVEAESLLLEKHALSGLKTRGPARGKFTENRIRGIERLRHRVGRDLLVEGWVSGPCAQAADLRGINRLMVDFADDPAFVRDLFDFSVEIAADLALAQIQAGADIVGVGDAAASLVGPRIYREFVWPWEKQLVDAIHAQGSRVRLHICGNARRILGGIGELGCDLVDIDFPVPLAEARAAMGPHQTMAGNLDPVRDLRAGAPATIAVALQACQKSAGARWVVAPGCEIVRDTPHTNVAAMVDFARRAV